MKILTKFIIILLYLTVFLNTAFCGLEEKPENIKDTRTIKEIKTEIDTYSKEKIKNHEKLIELKKTLKIDDYLIDNLKDTDIEKLKKIFKNYQKTANKLLLKLAIMSKNLKNTDKIKKTLMENKKNIYIKIIPFIKKNKIEKYKNFIKNDINIFKEKNELKDKSIRNNVILKERVKNIKEKIIEHKILLNEKLKKILSKKIDEKIQNIKTNENFLKFKQNKKIEIIDKMLKKVDLRLSEIWEVLDSTSILSTKIKIYDILRLKLKKFRQEIINSY